MIIRISPPGEMISFGINPNRPDVQALGIAPPVEMLSFGVISNPCLVLENVSNGLVGSGLICSRLVWVGLVWSGL